MPDPTDPTAPTAVQPPTTLSDLAELISRFSAEKTVYFSSTGKLLDAPDADKPRKYDVSDVIAIKIKPLLDEDLVAINKIVDIDAPKKIAKPAAPGQPATVAAFGLDEYDYLDPEFQRKMSAARKLQRAAIIVGGLVELKVEGESLEQKANFLSKNFPTRLLNFLREEIEAISSGEIKALELASFT